MVKFTLIAMIVLFCSSHARSQDDRYVLSIGSVTTASPEEVEVAVMFDSVIGTLGAPNNVAYWTYGVCSDDFFASVISVTGGATTATINGGFPPGFNSTQINPDNGAGFAVGVVVDMLGLYYLAPGSGYELNIVTYQVHSNPGVMHLHFCDTLGDPPFLLAISGYGGSSLAAPSRRTEAFS